MKHSKKYLERYNMHCQGRSHKRFGMRPYWKSHKYYSDYMDGYHDRPFKDNPKVTWWHKFKQFLGV